MFDPASVPYRVVPLTDEADTVFDPASVPYRVVPLTDEADTVFDPASVPYKVPELIDETIIEDGKSEFTSARNVGAPDPNSGPAKIVFWPALAVPRPPEEIPRGVPRVRTSIKAPSETVRAVPGLELV